MKYFVTLCIMGIILLLIRAGYIVMLDPYANVEPIPLFAIGDNVCLYNYSAEVISIFRYTTTEPTYNLNYNGKILRHINESELSTCPINFDVWISEKDNVQQN